MSTHSGAVKPWQSTRTNLRALREYKSSVKHAPYPSTFLSHSACASWHGLGGCTAAYDVFNYVDGDAKFDQIGLNKSGPSVEGFT